MVSDVSSVTGDFSDYSSNIYESAGSNTPEIDNVIEDFLENGGTFEFSHKGHDYTIVEEGGNFVAYDDQGNIVDPEVQINSKSTVDGFLEVRGLYGTEGNALYIGNDPDSENGEVLFIEGDHDLNRSGTSDNPHLSTLLGNADESFTDGGSFDFDTLKDQLNFDDAQEYQLDNDTSINIDELDLYLQNEFGIHLTEDQLDELFELIDANGSGNIRERELDRFTESSSSEPKVEEQNNDNDDTPAVTNNDDDDTPSVGSSSTETSSVRYDVSRTEKSEWHEVDFPEGTVELQYESLDRPFDGTVSTDGADYILVIKSGGKVHHDIDNPEEFFGTQDGEMIGHTGSKDKGMMLIRVDDLDEIDIDTGDSSVQIVRIRTDEELTVLNDGGGALDNDLVEGGQSYDQGAVDKLGYSIDHRRVEAWDEPDSFFTVYADDESKYDHRVDKYGGASEVFYYGGDDSAYVMPPGAQADTRGSGSGNGAIMQIGFA